MADVNARREARRRKILENSEKRLNKISGVEQKSTKGELDSLSLGISYKNETDPSPVNDNIVETTIFKADGISSIQNSHSSSSLSGVKTIFQNPRTDENESVSNCQVEIGDHRSFRTLQIFVLPLVLSFILVALELFQIDVKSTYLNKIFIPLLVYEILEYFIGSPVYSTPNFLTSLLLLTNHRNRFLTAYVGYLQYFVKIMQDLMVYFFVFTLSHAFLTLMLL